MPSKVVTVVVAGVLGAACGVATAFALPRPVYDPLNLNVALVNQPCHPGSSIVMLEWGSPSSALFSAVSNNPGARYLKPSQSCPTTWRFQPEGATSVRPDPQYVVYLGPYETGKACTIRMEGSHKGTFVTKLTSGTSEMVQCVCILDLATAPDLRPGMDVDAETSIWIWQLQQMLHADHRLAVVTGDFDLATQRAVRTLQAKALPQPSGIVDAVTWQIITRTLCHNY